MAMLVYSTILYLCRNKPLRTSINEHPEAVLNHKLVRAEHRTLRTRPPTFIERDLA